MITERNLIMMQKYLLHTTGKKLCFSSIQGANSWAVFEQGDLLIPEPEKEITADEKVHNSFINKWIKTFKDVKNDDGAIRQMIDKLYTQGYEDGLEDNTGVE